MLSRMLTRMLTPASPSRPPTTEGDSQETQFLDYTTQQRTLFTLLATAYAYHFASSAIQKMYHDLQVREAAARYPRAISTLCLQAFTCTLGPRVLLSFSRHR